MEPTYMRQRFLLAFICQLADGVSSTDLQKLVFLYSMKESKAFYEFIPYKYGSYSFQLAKDIDTLAHDGFVIVEGSRIRATKREAYKTHFSIVTERGDDLIRKAYREYPYFAINSRITCRLFKQTEAEQFIKEKNSYKQTKQILFTIGYEGKSLEFFINTLIKSNIRLLCDVRKNPLSRKFGFSKGNLGHILEAIGIKYIHIPDLGIESEKRNNLDSTEDYRNLFEQYAKDLPSHQTQLDYVFAHLNSHVRIALMCYEKDPEMCHRHVIRDFLLQDHEIRSVDL